MSDKPIDRTCSRGATAFRSTAFRRRRRL